MEIVTMLNVNNYAKAYGNINVISMQEMSNKNPETDDSNFLQNMYLKFHIEPTPSTHAACLPARLAPLYL